MEKGVSFDQEIVKSKHSGDCRPSRCASARITALY